MYVVRREGLYYRAMEEVKAAYVEELLEKVAAHPGTRVFVERNCRADELVV